MPTYKRDNRCFLRVWGRKMENRHKKNKASTEVDALFSCGGPTRTGDLQVMSLASYQLLHSAIISIRFSSRLRCKGRHFFVHRQDLGEKKWKKISTTTILQHKYYRNKQKHQFPLSSGGYSVQRNSGKRNKRVPLEPLMRIK